MRKIRSILQAAVLVVATGAAGAVAFNALAADKTATKGGDRRPMCEQGHGKGGQHGPMHEGPGAMPFGGRMLDRMLDDVKAMAEQRKQIKTIADAAATDLKALHDGNKDLREQSIDALLKPQVDAEAAESLRQQMLADHDKVSKRMLQAMLDISKVLTPEQRAQVAEQMKKHREQRPEGPGARFRGEK